MPVLRFLPQGVAAPASELPGATRKAKWLLVPYQASVWVVTDSRDGKDTVKISFEMRMPDGRCLTEWTDFYRSVKEFAFLVRDGRYSRVRDAEKHSEYVYALMDIVHGLALRGFYSFAQANREYLHGQFLKYITQGTDAILDASKRTREWLCGRDMDERPGYKDGLPLYRRPDATTLRMLDSASLMRLIGLPDSACKLPRVAFLCNTAATEAGLRIQAKEMAVLPPLPTLTSGAIYRFLHALEMLHEMRKDMQAASLPEPPFDSASALAERLGVETKPTPLPPPSLALHLLSWAMVWVANYSDDLISLLRSAERVAKAKDAEDRLSLADMTALVAALPSTGPPGCPWPVLPRARARGAAQERLACAQAIRFLFMACRIVITAFSARRADEVDGLEVGDLEGEDRAWSLRPFIQKTLQRKDWIPVPDIVAKAFKVVTALSQTGRELTETTFVFQWWNPFEHDNNRVVMGIAQSGDEIDSFARWVRTPLWGPRGQTSTNWHWSWHQFRKFFAVLYFYRYRYGDIAVLAHYLRHFNIEMTREYLLKNKQLKEVFEEVEWNYVLDLSRDIAIRGASMEGGRTKLLFKKMVNWLGRQVRVTGDALEAGAEYIARQFRAQKLVVTPKAWVDCTCPRTEQGAAAAHCRSKAPQVPGTVGPDFENAGPSLCLACTYSVDNGRLKQAVLEESINIERTVASDLLAGSILSGIAQARIIDVSKLKKSANASK